MSTRSFIGILNKDNTIEYIYCHSDGYLDYVGRMLLMHYSNESKLRELLSNGDMSSIGKEIGTKHDFNKRPFDGSVCTFYHRDRNEKLSKPENVKSINDFYSLAQKSWAEYVYLFDTNNATWLWTQTYNKMKFQPFQFYEGKLKTNPEDYMSEEKE